LWPKAGKCMTRCSVHTTWRW